MRGQNCTRYIWYFYSLIKIRIWSIYLWQLFSYFQKPQISLPNTLHINYINATRNIEIYHLVWVSLIKDLPWRWDSSLNLHSQKTLPFVTFIYLYIASYIVKIHWERLLYILYSVPKLWSYLYVIKNKKKEAKRLKM